MPTNMLRLLQYYDPRVWVREGEKTLSTRVKEACADLGNTSMSNYSCSQQSSS